MTTATTTAAGSVTPPGPRGLPLVGVAPMLARDLYEYPRRMAARYGDVVRLPIPGQSLVLVSHPEHVNHVFNRHTDRYWKGEMNGRLGAGLGATPLPLADGEAWKRMRRLTSPLFGNRRLGPLSALMAEAVEDRVEGWTRHVGSAAPVDFEGELSALTMDVLMRAMFTRAPEAAMIDRAVGEFRAFAGAAAVRMATWWAPGWLPLPRARSGARAQAWIFQLIDRLVDERIARPLDGHDLLGTLLDARFEDGSGLTRAELSAELFGLVFAGFETTASALAWTIALLGADPDSLARAYAEVDQLGARRVGFEDLEQLPFIRACFDEAQRIQGAPFYGRAALADDEIGGCHIPRGSIVLISPYALHRDPRFWQHPERFRPERFLDDPIDKYAYVPFNVGPRRCLGMHMANIEAVFVIATTLQRYRLLLPPGFRPEHQFHVSTGIRGGCPIRVEPR